MWTRLWEEWYTTKIASLERRKAKVMEQMDIKKHDMEQELAFLSLIADGTISDGQYMSQVMIRSVLQQNTGPPLIMDMIDDWYLVQHYNTLQI
jgi:hypothetical protein